MIKEKINNTTRLKTIAHMSRQLCNRDFKLTFWYNCVMFFYLILPFKVLSLLADPRGTHLWEFIRDILLNPERNPGLIKWEDRTEGVFRFLKSEAVAQLWGKKKNNSSMTYEKLSRAMRYVNSYHTRGYINTKTRKGAINNWESNFSSPKSIHLNWDLITKASSRLKQYNPQHVE